MKFNILMILLLVPLVFACKKEEEEILSNQTEITNFEINVAKGVITGDEIAITLPQGTDLTNLSANATISTGATISPNPKLSADYSQPKTFTVTAQDGTTKKTYIVKVTRETVTPTAENPYPDGIFILKNTDVFTIDELDFRHRSGTIETQVFQKNNAGRKLENVSLHDIIPHQTGYLLFVNKSDGSGAQLYYTDLKLKILKEENLEKANILSGRYALLNGKVYYTNISDINQFNQPTNKAYIIDPEAQTLQKIDAQIKQFFATSAGELYYNSLVNGFHKVTNMNTLEATELLEFDDYSKDFVLDAKGRLWSTHKSKNPKGFIDFMNVTRGIFDYQLKLVAYDIATDKKDEGIIAETINADSYLVATSTDKIYVITNQNTHIDNPKKTLWELFLDGDEVQSKHIMDLPKLSSQNLITSDLVILESDIDQLIVFGYGDDATTNGSKKYYYEIDLKNAKTSEKTPDIQMIFDRNHL